MYVCVDVALRLLFAEAGRELREAAGLDGRPHLRHQVLIIAEIVPGQQHLA